MKVFSDFFPKNFRDLHVAFRSLINFELIITYSVGFQLRLIIAPMNTQCFWCHLWKRPPILHWIAFAPLGHTYVVLFLDFQFSSISHCVSIIEFLISFFLTGLESRIVFFSILFPGHLAQCLAHSKYRVNKSLLKVYYTWWFSLHFWEEIKNICSYLTYLLSSLVFIQCSSIHIFHSFLNQSRQY